MSTTDMMISQEQSEQVPPVEKQQWLISGEEWQRMKILLVILGIELPLLGGFWVWNNYPWYYAMFLSVTIGALLLRSWWAMLIVPVVFAIGVTLGIFLLPFLQGGWPAAEASLGSGMVEGLGVLLLLLLGAPAVIILTAIGAAIGIRLDRWITSVREY